MKILSWNCNRGFRDKYEKILKYDADIYVISEAERPEKYADDKRYEEYQDFVSNGFWLGGYKEGKLYEDKGILIFAKKNIKLENNLWNSKKKYFLSVRVNDSFNLVGVWTQPKYVEEIIPYLRIYEDKIKLDDIIFCGDFNSNKRFNDKHKGKDHCDMVKIFNSMGLHSAYHKLFGEKHGEESIPTEFQTFDEAQPYHLDYVFAKQGIIKELEIGTYDEYVKKDNRLSDHVPLIFEANI